MKDIILASKSIDRSKLFKKAGITFNVIVTAINEGTFKEKIKDPIKLAKELAKAKALEVKKRLEKEKKDIIVIAADTLISFNSEIIGKASNENEAFSILKKLRNSSHNLITGIAITETNNPKIIVDHSKTYVEFLNLSEKEIWEYIKTGEWKGRAGAYSIKDKASLFIKAINGSPTNVIGIPMHSVFEILKEEFGYNLIIC
jgi:septum formation protein